MKTALFWIAAMCFTLAALGFVMSITDGDDDAPKSTKPAPTRSAPSQPDLPTFKVQ